MNKIVIVNQSTGDLTIDVVNTMARKYDVVKLVAGRVKLGECPLDAKVEVDKIVNYNRSNTLKRVLAWAWGSMEIFLKIWLKYRDYEVMYFTNPPMSYWCSLLLNNKFSIVEYDIYPDALKNIGIRESNFVYRFWCKMNRKVFAKASKIITLSDGMADTLSHYGDRNKIQVIPNWCTSSKLRPVEKAANPFVKEYHLEDKFVVMYSGNIGYTHNVEYLVDVAECLKGDKDVMFCIIGEGMKKAAIMQKVKEKGLDSSFLFLTWQRFDMLPYSLPAGDVGVITLNDVTANLSVPSKTYNLLACGVPLLAIAPQKSELARLIEKYNNGVCYDKSQVREMAEFIGKMKSSPGAMREMKEHSLAAASHFTSANAELYVD